MCYIIKVSSQITGEKNGFFKILGFGKLDNYQKKKKKKPKSRFYLTPYTKVISKSNRYINVKIKQNYKKRTTKKSKPYKY